MITNGRSYQSRAWYLKKLGFASYRDYLESDLWQFVRKRVFEVKGRLCWLCGRNATQVHHTRYHENDLTGKKLKYVHPVCDRCHKEVEVDDVGRKRTFGKSKMKFNRMRRNREGSPEDFPSNRERNNMDSRLDNGNWAEVFGEGDCQDNCPPLNPQPQPPGSNVSTATFGREDVAEIFQMEDGENDEEEWIIYGRLKDGRFFAARGGCDYTGWDCQASNGADVALNKEDIIRFGLTLEERSRFGL